MTLFNVMVGVGFGLIASLLIAFNMRNRALTSKPRSKTEHFTPPDELCSICFEPMTNDKMKYFSCGHAVHDDCFRELRKHNISACPMCRV